MLSLYPQAGEGGGCFVSSKEPDRSYVAPGQGLDPERAAEEAARRARAKLRRYCAANRLNRLGTLTYGHPRCSDPGLVRAHVGLFFRQMRDKLGGDPLPYAWVPELHKDGVHFHVHFAVGRYVPRRLIESAWGRGHVHIKLLGDLPVGSGTLGEARLAARYLSKYVTKSFTDPATRAAGMHRYDLAQGFQPEATRLYGRSPGEVIEQASAMFGAQPAVRWNSDEVDLWIGPPAIWAQWDA
ncbi:rolling circle replication-associated protein [Kocuria rhizosphaericola]|uniref:rolling circle replication-associated protein n=1 Tax=Kocuria rhizosphaericola TaxID=3376284 RepID=UPI003F883E78